MWISEADIVAMMHLDKMIDALETGFRLKVAGAALNMVKTQTVWGDGHTLHAMGAAVAGG